MQRHFRDNFQPLVVLKPVRQIQGLDEPRVISSLPLFRRCRGLRFRYWNTERTLRETEEHDRSQA